MVSDLKMVGLQMEGINLWRLMPIAIAAGAGNLMATGSGWVWHDFEDTCSGPLAWDVAASTGSQRLDARRVPAAYGDPVDPATLARWPPP